MPRRRGVRRGINSIDVLEVIGVSDAITRRNPYRKNPNDREGNCLYTDPKNPARHCLGGEILLKLGCRLPTEHHLLSDTPDFTLFTSMALDWLDRVQALADGDRNYSTGPASGPPRPWRCAHDMAVREYALLREAERIKDTI